MQGIKYNLKIKTQYKCIVKNNYLWYIITINVKNKKVEKIIIFIFYQNLQIIKEGEDFFNGKI